MQWCSFSHNVEICANIGITYIKISLTSTDAKIGIVYSNVGITSVTMLWTDTKYWHNILKHWCNPTQKI
jgi:hypothetical protein